MLIMKSEDELRAVAVAALDQGGIQAALGMIDEAYATNKFSTSKPGWGCTPSLDQDAAEQNTGRADLELFRAQILYDVMEVDECNESITAAIIDSIRLDGVSKAPDAIPGAVPGEPEALIRTDAELRSTAYHEAGHAAADLVLGHGVLNVSIVPGDGNVGHAFQLDGDDMTPEGMADLVVAAYAGAEAQRRIYPDDWRSMLRIKLGAQSDDEIAERYLQYCADTADALRTLAAALVSKHWDLIELIADELLKYHVLDDTEVETQRDILAGDATHADLEQYRSIWHEQLAQMPGRKLAQT